MRDLTIKTVRGTVAIKGVFDNEKGLGSCYGGRGAIGFPDAGLRSSYGPLLNVVCGFGAFDWFRGAFKNVGPQLA